eukprot:scaffold543_cov119-Cylindrotheca_fusiformis.AAC.28
MREHRSLTNLALALLVACIMTTSSAFSTNQAPRVVGGKLQMSSQQPEYGQSVELTGTYVTCGRCETSYAIKEEDLGGGRGRRLECTVCGHSWFQSRDRLMSLDDGFEMIPLPERQMTRIKQNVEEGRNPRYAGDSKLYVGNISFASSEEDVYTMFSEAGEVGDVSLVRDDVGRNRGFGFVTMRTKEGGAKAMELLDGKDLNGRNLAVRESNN